MRSALPPGLTVAAPVVVVPGLLAALHEGVVALTPASGEVPAPTCRSLGLLPPVKVDPLAASVVVTRCLHLLSHVHGGARPTVLTVHPVETWVVPPSHRLCSAKE